MSHIPEKQAEQEPKRMKYAVEQLKSLGFEVQTFGETRIEFEHKGEIVRHFPYTGWHTGRSIKDGRGIIHLLKQLK